MSPVVVYYWDTALNLYRSEGGPDVQPPNYVPPPSGDFPGDPGPGRMYMGISLNASQETLAHYTTRTGWNPAMFRQYYPETGINTLVSDAKAHVAADRLPWMSMKTPGWVAVANGSQDSWLQNIAQQIATVPGPVWFTLHHEPHGDGSAADFVAMYNHAAPILHQASNLTFCSILNGYYMTRGGADPDPHVWYTSGADFIGYDQYNQWWTYTTGNSLYGVNDTAQTGPQEAYHPWLAASDTLGPGNLVESSWGKHTACAEYGCHLPWTETNKARQWVSDAYDYALQTNHRALVWFDQEQNSPRGGWWQEKALHLTGAVDQDKTIYPNTEREQEFLRQTALSTSIRLSDVVPQT